MQASSNSTSVEGPEDVLRQRSQQNSLETKPIEVVHKPHGRIPNSPLAASTISFILGSLFSLGASMYLYGGFRYWWSTYQLGFFLASWAAFHWGEFAVTAGWNREKCSVDSFLLDNGMMYHVAHSVALAEYLVTLWLKPQFKTHAYVSGIGVSLVVVGQILRSSAMIHAASNFSHTVAFRKLQTHGLVTDGIYAWCRHPSYAGFFYWALGTQLALQNPISFIFFTVVLWRFFNVRIKYEEQALVRFFGQDYVHYRANVGTKIPFIP